MGGGSSKPKTKPEKPDSTSTEVPQMDMPDGSIIDLDIIYPYLLGAFFAGVLLTFLITALICLIRRRCSKRLTSHSRQISQVSDSSHKCGSTAEEAPTCADMSLQDSEENRVYFGKHQNEDPIVYAQIKVQTRTNLPTNGSGEIY